MGDLFTTHSGQGRMWLPPSVNKPYDDPQNDRQYFLNKLHEINVFIPGAENMELSELKDYVEEYQGQAIEEAAAKLLAKETRSEPLSESEREVIKEYKRWRKRKDEGWAFAGSKRHDGEI